jgi:hypothetical protein
MTNRTTDAKRIGLRGNSDPTATRASGYDHGMKKILIALTLTACAGSANYWKPYQPAHGTTTATRADAVQKATIAITDAGEEVETSDAATGIVLSKWFSGDGMMSRDTRFRIRVVIGEAGYDVAALCQRKANTPTSNGWGDDCGDKRPAFVLDAMTRVQKALN